VASDARRAVCPGSYDPVTNGHIDVVTRAATLFDEVVVAVLYNPAKQGAFPVEERVSLLEESLAAVGNLRVEAFADRLLVDVCRDVGATAIVKGLRGGTDFAYELPMALMNKHLTGIETVFLPGDPRFEHVSSSLVKEVAAYGGDVTGLVPDPVLDALKRQFGA
jgi:pantetheine-phosphate adenylyltransferase